MLKNVIKQLLHYNPIFRECLRASNAQRKVFSATKKIAKSSTDVFGFMDLLQDLISYALRP